MQAGEQPHITEDIRQDHQRDVAAMCEAAASVREVTTTALLEVEVADARGTKLAATSGAEAAVSRAEAARAKGWPTLVK